MSVRSPQLDEDDLKDCSDRRIRQIVSFIEIDWHSLNRDEADLKWLHGFALDCDTLRTECLERFQTDILQGREE